MTAPYEPTRSCPRCHAAQVASARFCSNCAYPIGATRFAVMPRPTAVRPATAFDWSSVTTVGILIAIIGVIALTLFGPNA